MFNIKKIIHSDAFLFSCFFIVGLFGYFLFFSSETTPVSINGDYSDYFTGESNRIIVYSRESCQYCVVLAAYFEKNNIEYLDKDIERNDLARKEYEQLGGYGTPLVLFHDELIIGFRKKLILKKIQKLEKSQGNSVSVSHVQPQ